MIKNKKQLKQSKEQLLRIKELAEKIGVAEQQIQRYEN